MCLRHLIIAAFLPAVLAATPFLAGYSTGAHFSCTGTSCSRTDTTLPQSALPSLLSHLSSPSTAAASDLPFSAEISAQQAPELTLVVHSSTPSTPRAILDQLSAVTNRDSATSFFSAASGLPDATDARSVTQLADLAASAAVAMFADGKPDLVSVSVLAGEDKMLMDTVRALSLRVKGDLAVIWVGREDEPATNDTAPEGGDTAAAGADTADTAGTADTAAVGGDAAAEGDTAKADEKPNLSDMRRPEISEAGVAGLIVAFIFLMLFVPGFMCLWRIQPPETFEMIDSNDVKKKMQ